MFDLRIKNIFHFPIKKKTSRLEQRKAWNKRRDHNQPCRQRRYSFNILTFYRGARWNFEDYSFRAVNSIE